MKTKLFLNTLLIDNRIEELEEQARQAFGLSNDAAIRALFQKVQSLKQIRMAAIEKGYIEVETKHRRILI